MGTNKYLMNHKYMWIPIVASAAALTSCKEKTTTQQPSEEGNQNIVESLTAGTAGVADLIKKPVVISIEDRAAKLGFASRIPKNVTSYSSVMNGRQAFDKFLKTKLGAHIMERLAESGKSIDDLSSNAELETIITSYSEEYFSAYGPGGGEAMGQAVELYESILYYAGSLGGYATDVVAEKGASLSPAHLQQGLLPLTQGPLEGFLADISKALGEAEIPAVYQGAKVSDEAMRTEFLVATQESYTAVGNVPSMMGLNISEPIEFKKGDADFSGIKISGDKFVEVLKGLDPTTIESFVDPKDIEDLKKALAGKELIMAAGVIDDYVISFTGGSVDDLVFVDRVEDSVCARDELKSFDPYLDKDLLLVSFSSEEILEGVTAVESVGYRLVSALTKGFKNSIENASSLGDTQDMEALLGSVIDQGDALAGLFEGSEQNTVVYIEDGLKLESYGGSNLPSYDFTATHSLAPLANAEDTLFFANWTSNKEYNTLVSEYVDSLFETGYMLAGRISAFDIKVDNFQSFQLGYGMFDQTARAEITELSGALRGDLAQGLGAESAIVIDLNGTLPKVPDVPEAILADGKMPRVAFVSTVDDRAKLQSAWQRTNASIESILKKAGSMTGKEIPMQVPMSSEKNELKTWFIPIPFQSDDFVPSVSVSDELFFASTSKTFSEGLAEQFKQGSKTERKGAWINVNFAQLHQYVQDTYSLMDANADELITSDSVREDYEANKETLKSTLDALSEVDSFTSHIRKENGQVRISAHLKAK